MEDELNEEQLAQENIELGIAVTIKNKRIKTLEAEVARLRTALETIVKEAATYDVSEDEFGIGMESGLHFLAGYAKAALESEEIR